MEKEIPSTSTTQKGRRIKKLKIRVANKSPKKKYFSTIFVCIPLEIGNALHFRSYITFNKNFTHRIILTYYLIYKLFDL